MIEVKDLCKNFGTLKAVDHVSLKVEDGQVLSLLDAGLRESQEKSLPAVVQGTVDGVLADADGVALPVCCGLPAFRFLILTVRRLVLGGCLLRLRPLRTALRRRKP